jgi:hypothetical protein
MTDASVCTCRRATRRRDHVSKNTRALIFLFVGPQTSTASPTTHNLANASKFQVLLRMSAIGSLVFCTDCGNLLDGSAGKQNAILTCQVCGASCRGALAGIYNNFQPRAHITQILLLKLLLHTLSPTSFPHRCAQRGLKYRPSPKPI